MKKEIILSKDDKEKLAELYHKAQTTPVIAFNLEAAVGGEDMSTLAWNHVREFMDILGKKYVFNPGTCTINSITGEVREVGSGGKDKK